LLPALVFSCGIKDRRGEFFFKREEVVLSNTIISCPNKEGIFLRYTSQKQVEDAIHNAYKRKLNDKTSEDYTALKFGQNRSIKIAVPPEEMIKCEVTEIPTTLKEKEKAHFYFR
jgi:hypothetical protein